MNTTKAFIASLVGIVALIAVLFLLKSTQFKAMAQAGKFSPPADVVTAAQVTAERWDPTITAVGSLAPYQGVTVTTEASGIVASISFEPGLSAKAGDLLISLDTSVLEAQLQAAAARLELAKLNLVRARDLFAGNSSAKAELDSTEAQFKQAEADVTSTKALIAQKQVRAPFSGRLGIRQINVGQYIDRGNPIVSLQSLDPIYVNFSLPQQELGRLSIGMKTTISVDALPGQSFEGKVTAINPDVDSATRNVRVQATFANADEKLRPGMFVNVAVILPQKEDVLVIPVTSVLYAPYGDSVFVIEDKKDEKTGEPVQVLRQQFVRLGKSRGDMIVILSGLEPAQKIASTGVFKLRNGMTVTVDNKLAPEASESPKPGNS
ncbi:MAG: efflux RND transporter periplasmic adaptor subunit [Opitutaceae bacterium]|jgi:membrane fusion protein (multidrug efflux system)